jgi:hypothetical protein
MPMSVEEGRKLEASTFTTLERCAVLRGNMAESHEFALAQMTGHSGVTEENLRHMERGMQLAYALIDTFTAEADDISTGAVIYGLMSFVAAAGSAGLTGVQQEVIAAALMTTVQGLAVSASMTKTADQVAEKFDPRPQAN